MLTYLINNLSSIQQHLTGVSAMPDENTVRFLVHRQNIRRYRSLLKTPLTAIEREFVEQRIGEEEAEIHRVTAESNWQTALGASSPEWQAGRAGPLGPEQTSGC